MKVKKTILIIIILLTNLFFVKVPFVVPLLLADDWPQVQHDPQHSGYSPETLGTNFKVAWRHAFQPDRVHPQTQVIIYSGKVFVGTEGANGQKPSIYAFDATNGAQIWKYEAGGPILNSAAAGDGKVFFASMDGSIYALNADSGSLIWVRQVKLFDLLSVKIRTG